MSQQGFNPLSHDPQALSWTKHVNQTSASGLYDENDQYNEHIPCVVVVLLFVPVRHRFQQFFGHITTVSGCDRELNAHFSCAASLKYHAPDT